MDPKIPQDPREAFKLVLTRTKITMWTQMGWAILVLFFSVGVLAGHQNAWVGLALIAIMWTSFEIIERGIVAWRTLKIMKEMGDDPETYMNSFPFGNIAPKQPETKHEDVTETKEEKDE